MKKLWEAFIGKIGGILAIVLVLVLIIGGGLWYWNYRTEQARIEELEGEKHKLIRINDNAVVRERDLKKELDLKDTKLSAYQGEIDMLLGDIDIMTETLLVYEGLISEGIAVPVDEEVYFQHKELTSIRYNFDDNTYKGWFECPTASYLIEPYPVEFGLLIVRDENGKYGVETDNKLLVIKDFVVEERIKRKSFLSKFSGSLSLGYTGELALKGMLGYNWLRVDYSQDIIKGEDDKRNKAFYVGIGF